jgi:hypothetical protein
MLMKSMDAPNAHMVLGIIWGEKREEKIRDKFKKEKQDEERLNGLWVKDIGSPLLP